VNKAIKEAKPGIKAKHVIKVWIELDKAMNGVASSIDFVCQYVWDNYGTRIFDLYSADRADDKDDLQQIFWMTVAKHIPKLDERGDLFYHLGQRGFWAVGAHIRRKESMVRLLSLDAPRRQADGDGDATIADSLRDPAVDVEGIVVNQLGSGQQVSMILNLQLAPIAERALDAIMSGQAGDPSEIGFNKKLAAELGVSPQRASQAMQSLRSAVIEGGVEV
jgi:hypothetical protein